jgi:hypothetical protein
MSVRVITVPFNRKLYIDDATGLVRDSRSKILGNYFTQKAFWKYGPPGWEESQIRAEENQKIAEENARIAEIARIEEDERARLDQIKAEEERRIQEQYILSVAARVEAEERAAEIARQESARIAEEELERIKFDQREINKDSASLRLRGLIESYILSGLKGKKPAASLDEIRAEAAYQVFQRGTLSRDDFEGIRVAAEEAAKAAYNDELRRAVDSLLSIWGTTNAEGSHQRVIRDFTDAADSVPVNPTGTDEQRLQWALQVLQGGAQAYRYFSKKGFGEWQEAVIPITRIYASAARIYPEWIPDYEVIMETGIPEPGPVDYRKWVSIAPQLGFKGQSLGLAYDSEGGAMPGGPTIELMQFVDAKRLEGFDFVAHRGNFHNYNNLFGFKLPNGEVVGQTRTGDDDDIVALFRQVIIPIFSFAGGFAFLGGQIAGFTGIPANYASGFLRAAVATAGGQDVDRALLSALGPVVIQDILPPTVWQAPDLGTIEPELVSVGDEAWGDASIVAEVAPALDMEVAELIAAPVLLPEVEPPPVFDPLPEPVAELIVAPELPPELLPPPESIFEPVYVAPPEPLPEPVFEPVAELLAPPNLPPELLPPTIEPPGVPIMDDFFAAEDYALPTWEAGSVDDGFFFDFDTLDPIPTVDAGDWFVGPMPLPDFPAIEDDFSWTAPVEAGAVEDLITVGDIQIVTGDVAANYIGTGGAGGIVETGGTGPGTTVIEVIKDATAAMVAALGLVQAYRALTSKPAPNPVAQARQGQNTVRANPNGTITTTAPNGQTRTARPPVGQPQMTTDGTMIVNNGDGTYTRIGRDGQSVINRYPLDITDHFGAAASSPYTLPLLIAGGAALVLFATRKR